jgi:hypothetical protein
MRKRRFLSTGKSAKTGEISENEMSDFDDNRLLRRRF